MARKRILTPLQVNQANFDSHATAGDLHVGELFYITDRERLAIGKSASTYTQVYNTTEIDTMIGDIETILESI